MYVDRSTVRSKSGKSYTRYLLRESYREDGKVKHRTIANLSRCKPQEIEAIRLALRHKADLTQWGGAGKDVQLEQGLSIGAVWTVHQVARELGIVKALGSDRQGKLALWQVIARVIDQGSRLSAVRLAGSHAACDILNLDSFHEEHLYANLDWLCQQQADIERRLFQARYPNEQARPKLFLYDVTSSYLEGTHNELSAFGYNRDGKRGKQQIVIGLLCDQQGVALSIEVFQGNTSDPKTFLPQVRKAAQRFGASEVTFVGDRERDQGATDRATWRGRPLYHGDHQAPDREAARLGRDPVGTVRRASGGSPDRRRHPLCVASQSGASRRTGRFASRQKTLGAKAAR